MFRESTKLALILLLSLTTLAVVGSAHAEDEDPVKSATDDKKVIYEYPDSVDSDYRSTRNPFGFTFQIGKRDFLPTEYRSAYDQKNYQALFGKGTIPMVGAAIGIKQNYTQVSAELFVEYYTGKTSDGRSSTSRSLEVKKQGVGLNLFFDGYTAEPRIVPHLGVKYLTAGTTEICKPLATTDTTCATAAGESSTKTDSLSGTEFQLGALISLYGAEPDTAKRANREYGLKLSALDIYVEKTSTAKLSSGPDLTTNWDLGLGLRFEF